MSLVYQLVPPSTSSIQKYWYNPIDRGPWFSDNNLPLVPPVPPKGHLYLLYSITLLFTFKILTNIKVMVLLVHPHLTPLYSTVPHVPLKSFIWYSNKLYLTLALTLQHLSEYHYYWYSSVTQCLSRL